MLSKLNKITLAIMLALPIFAHARGDASSAMQAVQNGNLVSQVSKQSQLVSGQIRDYANQLEQYQSMLQNLKNVPVEKINESLAPYKETLETLGQVGKAVNDVYVTSNAAKEVYDRRIAEMNRLKLDPEQYMLNEIVLANSKGGIYKQQMDSDYQKMLAAREKSAKLASMQDQVNSISGNVQGLQTLAQQNQMMATELADTNVILREERMARLASQAAKSEKSEGVMKSALEQYKKNEDMKKKTEDLFKVK